MNNENEELSAGKKKENINMENSLLTSFEDCPFRSNTFQSNINATKGRVNNIIEISKQYNNKTSKSLKKNSKKDNEKRLNAIKKCFQIVKDRKELNKTIIGQSRKRYSENKYLNEGARNNEKDKFSNTCNSFYNKKIDSFINNYLKNNLCVK